MQVHGMKTEFNEVKFGTENYIHKDDFDILKNAFLDILDGTNDYFEIQYLTGLDFKRCEEILSIAKSLRKNENYN
jgi:hypothetical protein